MTILPILIVGAGPTGLMMACELARHGIAVRLIDKKPQATLTSNAIGIQSRTLEIFNHIGVINAFLQVGNRCDGGNIFLQNTLLTKLNLNHLASTYPFILMLAQSETERLLTEHLQTFNVQIERCIELIEVNQNQQTVDCTLKHADGKLEKFSSTYLIACDGSNSAVRQKINMAFIGDDIAQQFVIADLEVESHLNSHELYAYLNKGKLLASFPLSNNHYRIVANLDTQTNLNENFIIDMVKSRTHQTYQVKKIAWYSPFWIHSKLINKMQNQRIFFVGDAAHVHSPAGAQGMNTGIQDAYNLAWKLALVIKQEAKPELLASYHQERFPIVGEIVRRTEKITKIGLALPDFFIKLLKFISPILRQPWLTQKIARTITQINIYYKNSSIINYHGSSLAGKRAPNLWLTKDTCLYDFFRNIKHNVLLFSGLNGETKEETLRLKNSLLNNELINVYIIACEKNLGDIFDEQGDIHRLYAMQQGGMCIVRPDTYLAYNGLEMSQRVLEGYFARFR